MSNSEENPTFGQANHTLTIVVQQNPTADNLRMLHDGYLAALMQGIRAGTIPELSKFKGFVMGDASLTAEINTLSVDYSQTLPDMISACFGFGANYLDITVENFPVVGSGVVEVEYKIFHGGRTLASGELEALVVAHDSARPWVPAKIEHLLAYGVANPGQQRKHPIVALGSVAMLRGVRHVPYLGTIGIRRVARNLDLSRLDGDWDGIYRFLAVRPVLKPLAE